MSNVLSGCILKGVSFRCAPFFHSRNISSKGIIFCNKSNILITPKGFQFNKNKPIESLSKVTIRWKSFGGYSNFGHRDEKTPTITRVWYSVILFCMACIVVDWDFAFNYWKEDLKKRGYFKDSDSVITISTPELVACSTDSTQNSVNTDKSKDVEVKLHK